MENKVQEPQGIPFFSIKTGETHYGKLEATISAYINSSNMGINASRGQDYGWRLAPEWVQKVRDFKRDATKMSILTAKNQGQKPTTVQILYYMYGEQLARYFESMEDQENPFEDQYNDAISGRAPITADTIAVPKALEDFREAEDEDEDAADLIDEVMTEDEDEAAPAPEQPKTTGVDPAKPGADKSVETKTEPKKADTKSTQKKQ